ncbi:unnamed protein product [Cuscuta campestris]|uniref:Integrase catalytic domain-containing protein n=1 Tax=Cuscuta campestris TaxID=132261 RepID=A0A484KVZ1_9ASTE|nr:unnamed protein product [Cuscuta campestris]
MCNRTATSILQIKCSNVRPTIPPLTKYRSSPPGRKQRHWRPAPPITTVEAEALIQRVGITAEQFKEVLAVLTPNREIVVEDVAGGPTGGKAGPTGSQGKKKKVRLSQKKKTTKPNGKGMMEDALSRLDEEDESSSFERMSAFDRLGDPKSKKPQTSAFERLQDTRSARKGDLRDTLKEKRGESTATSKVGSEERRRAVEEKGAAELWRIRIMSCPLPDNFKTPQIKAYNGTTDPQDHLARFGANVVMYAYPEEIKCRCFLATLEGQACEWFHKLPKGSIDKWSDLAHKFLEHFASIRRQKLPFSHLLNVKIRKGEQLREFISRWEKEARDVQGADDQALIAMLQAALPQGDVRNELRRNLLSTYQEMLARTKYLALEEEDDEPVGGPGVRNLPRPPVPEVQHSHRGESGKGEPKLVSIVLSDKIEEVTLYPAKPEQKVKVGKTLLPRLKEQLLEVLQAFKVLFAWGPEDMPGVDPKIICHRLAVDPTHKPVKQKKRFLSSERREFVTKQAHPVHVLSQTPIGTLLQSSNAPSRVRKWGVFLGSFQIEFKPRPAIKGQALADFVVECTAREEESNGEEPEGNWWTVYTDGSSATDASGGGVVAISPEGFKAYYSVRFLFKVSNNEAEYEALLCAKVVKRRAPSYTLECGRLYKRSYNGTLLRCLRSGEAQKLMEEIHEGICSAHQGAFTMSRKVTLQGYFWPTIIRDCAEYVRRCKVCQEFQKVPGRPATNYTPISTAIPFARWGIDLVGILPRGTGNNTYLVVAIDYFTKWVEAAPVPTITEEQMRKFVSKQILCRFGSPSRSSPTMEPSLRLEGSMSFYKARKKIMECKSAWGEELTYILWTYRTTPRKATGETSFSLTYGFEARAPAEISLLSYRVETFDAQENEENLRAELHLIDERRERAYIRAENYRRQVKSYHDQRVRPRQFGVGDWVLRKREVSRPTNRGKFAKSFEGPYIIKEVLADGMFRLQTPAGGDVPRVWNAANLIKFYQ